MQEPHVSAPGCPDLGVSLMQLHPSYYFPIRSIVMQEVLLVVSQRQMTIADHVTVAPGGPDIVGTRSREALQFHTQGRMRIGQALAVIVQKSPIRGRDPPEPDVLRPAAPDEADRRQGRSRQRRPGASRPMQEGRATNGRLPQIAAMPSYLSAPATGAAVQLLPSK